ncbi:MAG: oligoendopeptidase F [Lachnospiraceae bacterium]|jgi:oligoendopeptidase F|nr:oligoendopeptidase F [Lachnospiraceae bacterium]
MEHGNIIRKRADVPREHTWATEDIFPSDEAWEQAFRRVKERLSSYEQFQGHLGDSAEMLYGCLAFDEQIGMELDRIYGYAHLRSDVDTGNPVYQKLVGRASSLYSEASAASSFIPSEILAIPEETLSAIRKEGAGTGEFERALDLIIREREHVRSLEVEKLLADVSEVTGGPSQIFKMFNNADTKFPMIKNEKGEEVELTHGRYVTFLESRTRSVRREAFQAMYATFGRHKNTLAAAFQTNVKQAYFYAKTRNYPSARAYYLADAAVPEAVYDTLIDTVWESMPLMFRYVALRKKMLQVDELHMYDLYTPIVPESSLHISYEEAKETIQKALQPMGEEYLAAFQEGLGGRWIDFMENEGKRSGAYCSGPYGVHPYVLMSYQGNLDNVFTLAHEMGHAMHSYFSNKNQTFTNAQYKIFVAEVASTCNECLLNRYLLEHAESKRERAFILNHFLDGFKGTVFRQTMFAEFEKLVHEKNQAGEVLTADVLSELYRGLNKAYFGDGIVIDEEIAMEWARIPHFYTPFYVYQYATGFSAAVALSERILKDGQEAVEAYMGFLKGGCSKDPIDLLADAGVDMRTKEPVKAAMKVFERALSEIEELLA